MLQPEQKLLRDKGPQSSRKHQLGPLKCHSGNQARHESESYIAPKTTKPIKEKAKWVSATSSVEQPAILMVSDTTTNGINQTTIINPNSRIATRVSFGILIYVILLL